MNSLSLMTCIQFRDSFNLHNELFIHDVIGDIFSNKLFFVTHRQMNLLFKMDSA